MSIHDPIDLDAIKQAVFRENLHSFLNNVYFWMIIDQNADVLSCSSIEKLNSICSSIKLSTHDSHDLYSIELIKLNMHSVAIPVNVYSFNLLIDNQKIILKIYTKHILFKVDFNLFCFSSFDRIDKYGVKLSFLKTLKRLTLINPLEKLTTKEWLISWLLINRYTNPEIAKITNNKINTINKAVDRILGPKKLAVFDRHLLSDIGRYLNWDCYIPMFLINTV